MNKCKKHPEVTLRSIVIDDPWSNGCQKCYTDKRIEATSQIWKGLRKKTTDEIHTLIITFFLETANSTDIETFKTLLESTTKSI